MKPRQSRGAISLASILSESRNYPNCVHWRIFYFMWLRRIYKFFCLHSNPIWKAHNCCDYRPSHLTFREYFRLFWFCRSCVVVSRGMQCENWTAHAPITIQRSVIFFLFLFFFVQRWRRTDKPLYIWATHASITIQ